MKGGGLSFLFSLSLSLFHGFTLLNRTSTTRKAYSRNFKSPCLEQNFTLKRFHIGSMVFRAAYTGSGLSMHHFWACFCACVKCHTKHSLLHVCLGFNLNNHTGEELELFCLPPAGSWRCWAKSWPDWCRKWWCCEPDLGPANTSPTPHSPAATQHKVTSCHMKSPVVTQTHQL